MSFRHLMATCLVPLIQFLATSAPGQPDPVQWSEAADTRVVRVEPSNAKDVPAMRITLTVEPLRQMESGYESTYSVTVFPFFFFNETGSIRIDLPPGTLEQLGAGQAVSFTGEGVNQSNARRLIEGRATPTDTRSGRIRIVVKIGGIELIFKTTYRFVGDEGQEVANRQSTPRRRN